MIQIMELEDEPMNRLFLAEWCPTCRADAGVSCLLSHSREMFHRARRERAVKRREWERDYIETESGFLAFEIYLLSEICATCGARVGELCDIRGVARAHLPRERAASAHYGRDLRAAPALGLRVAGKLYSSIPDDVVEVVRKRAGRKHVKGENRDWMDEY